MIRLHSSLVLTGAALILALSSCTGRHTPRAVAETPTPAAIDSAVRARVLEITSALSAGDLTPFSQAYPLRELMQPVLAAGRFDSVQQEALLQGFSSSVQSRMAEDAESFKQARYKIMSVHYRGPAHDTALVQLRYIGADDELSFLEWIFLTRDLSTFYDVRNYYTGVHLREKLSNLVALLAMSLNDRITVSDSLRQQQRALWQMSSMSSARDYTSIARWYLGLSKDMQANPFHMEFAAENLSGMQPFYQEKVVDVMAMHTRDNSRYSLLMATHWAKRGQFDRSLRELDKLSSVLVDTAGLAVIRARLYSGQKQYGPALHHYALALQKEKQWQTIWLETLDVLAASQQWDLLAEALEIMPGWLDVTVNEDILRESKIWQPFFTSEAYKQFAARKQSSEVTQ